MLVERQQAIFQTEFGLLFNTHYTGTGESLFQTVWMGVFQGEPQPTLNSITEAAAYDMLARGENIYGNYNIGLAAYHTYYAKKCTALDLNFWLSIYPWGLDYPSQPATHETSVFVVQLVELIVEDSTEHQPAQSI